MPLRGEDVAEFDYDPYLATPNPLFGRLRDRLLVSPGIAALNKALVSRVETQMPDYVWLDEPVFVDPDAVRRLSELGARIISYMPDDPYGPRRDPVWRLFRAALPHYWAHVVTRDVTRREFIARGARRVIHVPFAFEPSIHFPAPPAVPARPREFDVIFVGSPYDQRASWIMRLAQESPGLRIGLFGPGWTNMRRRCARPDSSAGRRCGTTHIARLCGAHGSRCRSSPARIAMSSRTRPSRLPRVVCRCWSSPRRCTAACFTTDNPHFFSPNPRNCRTSCAKRWQ